MQIAKHTISKQLYERKLEKTRKLVMTKQQLKSGQTDHKTTGELSVHKLCLFYSS